MTATDILIFVGILLVERYHFRGHRDCAPGKETVAFGTTICAKRGFRTAHHDGAAVPSLLPLRRQHVIPCLSGGVYMFVEGHTRHVYSSELFLFREVIRNGKIIGNRNLHSVEVMVVTPE